MRSLQNRQEEKWRKKIGTKFKKNKKKLLKDKIENKSKTHKRAKDKNYKSKEWRLILKYPQLKRLPWNFKWQTWISRERRGKKKKKMVVEAKLDGLWPHTSSV
jgi:hypothetical protein